MADNISQITNMKMEVKVSLLAMLEELTVHESERKDLAPATEAEDMQKFISCISASLQNLAERQSEILKANKEGNEIQKKLVDAVQCIVRQNNEKPVGRPESWAAVVDRPNSVSVSQVANAEQTEDLKESKSRGDHA